MRQLRDNFDIAFILFVIVFSYLNFSIFTENSCYAGGPTWAWEDGGYERDGSVTLEGESYDVNPTGAWPVNP